MSRRWVAGSILAVLGVLAGFAAREGVEAGCNELAIVKSDPYEQTNCSVCEDRVTGIIWNTGATQLTCVYLIYDDDDNISTENGYPELWIDNENEHCAFVPPMQLGIPGWSNVCVYSQRNDWGQEANMIVALSFPCLPPFTKYFTARWTTNCPYCN